MSDPVITPTPETTAGTKKPLSAKNLAKLYSRFAKIDLSISAFTGALGAMSGAMLVYYVTASEPFEVHRLIILLLLFVGTAWATIMSARFGCEGVVSMCRAINAYKQVDNEEIRQANLPQ